MITLESLPHFYENYPNAFLFCEECQDQCSHNPADYFDTSPDFIFTCKECDRNLVLAEEKIEVICS